MHENQLILGDNLEILKTLPAESVDLIYLDPPFFSNRNYEVIWGDSGEIRSFQDRWLGGISHYIDWLKERVAEMHRILKPTGSIFLHCDWHADGYIRVEILDKIFSYNRLQNIIAWKRATSGSSKAIAKRLGTDHDVILYYTKSTKFTFNPVWLPYPEKEIEKRFKQKDERGHYKDAELATYSKETLERLKQENRLIITASGKYRYKIYLDEIKGVLADDIWTDIPPVNSQSKQRIGYPTQKPEALLERIIRMASNEGDIVLDPFVGGGTTVAVADRLKRRWLGIDQSVQAVKVTEMRLKQQQDLFSIGFTVKLHTYDYDTLRYQDAFEFESFIVTQYGGTPNSKQRGDLGIDGKTLDGSPIQVKRSDNIGRNVIDNFQSAIRRWDKRVFEKAQTEGQIAGYLIAFSFGKGAFEEVARLKNTENVIIKLVKVDEIIPISRKPTLDLSYEIREKDKKGLQNVQFKAVGQSAVGIEFYSWDLNYDVAKAQFQPEILLDKLGEIQSAFKTGIHHIAVKVVDNNGLETVKIVTVKV